VACSGGVWGPLGTGDMSAFTGGVAVAAEYAEASVCTLKEEAEGGFKTGTPKGREEERRPWGDREEEGKERGVPLWETSLTWGPSGLMLVIC